MKLHVAAKTVLAFLAALAALAAPPASAAEPNPWDGQWHYWVTPYLWLPGVNGEFRFDLAGGVIPLPPSTSITTSPDSYLTDLQFAAMIAGEARKGNVSLYTDLMYIDFADLASHVTSVGVAGGGSAPGVSASLNNGLRGTIWTLLGGYTVARSNKGYLDLAGGVRYAGLDVSTDWSIAGTNGLFARSGSVDKSIDLWDGIVGVKGQWLLTPSGDWFVPYYADIGAGTESNWTWQAYAGLGYRWSWGDAVLLFRNLSYDQSGDHPIQKLDLTGPALGVTFRW